MPTNDNGTNRPPEDPTIITKNDGVTRFEENVNRVRSLPKVGNKGPAPIQAGAVSARMGQLASNLKLARNNSYSNKAIFESIFDDVINNGVLNEFPDVVGFWLRDPIKASLIIHERTGAYKGVGKNNVIRRFIMQEVGWRHEEKHQVIETFGQPIIYFFGERPIIMNVSGVLYDTLNMPWLTSMMDRYESDLRGTRLNWLGHSLFLAFDNHTIEGFILGMQMGKTGVGKAHAGFNFSFLVVRWQRGKSTEGSGGRTFEEPETKTITRIRNSTKPNPLKPGA